MAQAAKYNAQGEKIGTVELNDAVFGVRPVSALIHQVYTAERANLREPWADTKKRGEVRGGGRKPWQQKGTGRARHGSIRSPIWKGGGVTFGPLSTRNYKQKINKKMAQGAIRMCVSDKVAHGLFAVVDALPIGGKTSAFVALRKRLPDAGTSTLFLVADRDASMERGLRNMPRVTVCRAADANTMDVLHHHGIVATEQAVEALSKRLS